MSVPISVILRRKGREVFTVAPEATLAAAAEHLTEKGVGALVVSADGLSVAGILSERDVVRALARSGPDALHEPVSEVMTAEVWTCEPSATVDELMGVMTERRVRHVPVLEDERLAGMVSIGDVVKSRLDELEVQTRAMEQYVMGAS